MTAFQCDICNAFYNKNAHDPEGTINPFTGGPLYFTRRRLGVAGEKADFNFFDVCPTCMTALTKVCKRINEEGTAWIK